MFPAMAKEVFCYANIDQNKLKRAVELADDQQKIREALVEKKLVAFVADGAILPRESGVSDLPVKGSSAVCLPGGSGGHTQSAACGNGARHGDKGRRHADRGRRLSWKVNTA